MAVHPLDGLGDILSYAADLNNLKQIIQEIIHMTQEEYWYWLCNIQGLYQDGIKKLLKVFYDPAEIYKASEDMLVKSGCVDKRRAHDIVMSKNNLRSMYRLDKLKKDGITFVYYGSNLYPEAFLTLEDKPYALYLKGRMPDPEFPSVGIVGARSCSGYGKEMALKCSQTLAINGIQIISGMAVGVDSYASRGALEAGGKTFVVLGSGIDVIYPQENIELYYQIILNGGGVMSEYPMGTAPIGWQFPHRNRLISALSDKLLIIEARKHSGTLTTAAYALAQGKDIYAVPGRITDPLSEGCNRLIADGAGLLLNPMDMVEQFYGESRLCNISDTKAEKTVLSNDHYAKINKALDYDSQTIEQIASKCFLPMEEVSACLTEMELMGMCSQVSQGLYARI